MNVSITQKQLIELLKALGLKENKVIGIMLTLKKENQLNQMIDYIRENRILIIIKTI